MSHYTVLVHLPGSTEDLDAALETALSPFDENRDVPAYRDYEEGSPEGYWWVGSVRRGAEHHRDGTGLRPYNPEMLGYSSSESRETPQQQQAGFAEDAKWAERLGEHPTWGLVVELYNERRGHGNALAATDDTSDSETLYVDDDGRAYTLSTRNPQSKWDWYQVGGRWQRSFISTVGPGDPAARLLVHGSPGSFGDDGTPRLSQAGTLRCDGGPRRLLDFGAMRAAARLDAGKRYDRWETLCKKTPPAKSWSHFFGLSELGELTIEDARRIYREQPRIARAKEFDLESWSDCVVDEFAPDREEYLAEAALSAVPGYALLTIDGQWWAPGRMGWFGMSSDEPGTRSAYRVEANRYLDEMPSDDLLVLVDAHI